MEQKEQDKDKDYKIGYQKGVELKRMAPSLLKWRVAEARRLIREGYSERWSPNASGLSIEFLKGFIDGTNSS